MAATKSQLPMIRSLKAIARRKANVNHCSIPVPEEVRQRFVQEAKAAKKKQGSELRALFRRQTKSLLVNLLLKKQDVLLTPAEEEQIVAFKTVLNEVQKSIGPIHDSAFAYNWREEQKNKAEELFNELENIELKVIAGESVDLAPYAAALKS